jgi:hypothetical protein
MKKILLLLIILFASACVFAQTAKNPFEKYGYKKQVMFTLSKGEFEEFHDQTDIVEIGSVLFNTKTNKITGFIDEEKASAEIASSTAAMSIDPLCEKYYWISPYAYCANNPIKFIDPDGKQMSTAIRFLRDPLKFIKVIKFALVGTGTGIIYNHFVDGDKSTEVANSLIERAKSIDEARAASQEQINYQKRQQSLSDAEEVDISINHNQNMRDNNSDGDEMVMEKVENLKVVQL